VIVQLSHDPDDPHIRLKGLIAPFIVTVNGDPLGSFDTYSQALICLTEAIGALLEDLGG